MVAGLEVADIFRRHGAGNDIVKYTTFISAVSSAGS
jgi:hypothetical protein